MTDGSAAEVLWRTLPGAKGVLQRVYDAGFQAQWLGADLGCRRDLRRLADRVRPLLSPRPSASPEAIEATLAQIVADLEVICRAIPGYRPEGIRGLDPRRVGPSALASILAGADEVRELAQAQRDLVEEQRRHTGSEAPPESQEARTARRRAIVAIFREIQIAIFFGADCIGDDADVTDP